VLIIDELEVGEGELLFYQFGQLVEDRLCPMAYEDDELVDVPTYAATGNLRVVTLELGFLMFGLGFKKLLGSYLSMQLRVVDEW
jgi:hypothetical protein